MLIFGRKHYVFSRPSDVSALFRKTKVLSMTPFVRMVNNNLFGFKTAAIERMDTVHNDMHGLYNKYLLSPDQYIPVVNSYFKALEPLMQDLKVQVEISKDQTLKVDAFGLMLDTLAKASLTAYFGKEPLRVDPNLARDMSFFVTQGFWPLLAGIPAVLFRTVCHARERGVKAFFDTIVDAPDAPHDGMSAFSREHVKLLATVVDKNDVARNEYGFLFGYVALKGNIYLFPRVQAMAKLTVIIVPFSLISNSTPSTYLSLVRILSIPGLIDEIRKEIQASGLPTTPAADLHKIIPAQLTLLRSCYFETIRMHTVSASIREVLEDTEVVTKPDSTSSEGEAHTYTLKKGGVVNMPSSMLHYNPDFNPDPEKFMPKRFVSKEQGGLGQKTATSTRSFGGGASYCPGRIFAERQIVGYLAIIISTFDIWIDNEGSWQLPKTAEFDDVSKSKHAVLGMKALQKS